ncbi:hypothetical protein [Afifella sp. IM 167]|uniref:hypothetical protein n=1 Tax=Afifella sp. IM 167 TaxID=2033586 RepID=UPI001CCC7B1C|nr:hypothetical protein [Afifella sp. IM 167]MBZ8133382.1 hypothetical protein [Afifella sp. IM 167]
MSDETNAGGENPAPPPPAKRIPMVFTAQSWTASFRLNRSGRMESEAAYAIGELAWRGEDGTHNQAARLSLVKRDANERLELSFAQEIARLTVPIDESALQRMIERIKDYVSGHDMLMRVVFNAAAGMSHQYLEAVDISFSSRSPKSGPDQD